MTELTEGQIIKLATLWKVERDINKSMREFGEDRLVTISDATRSARKSPELVKILDEMVDKLEKFEEDKKEREKKEAEEETQKVTEEDNDEVNIDDIVEIV